MSKKVQALMKEQVNRRCYWSWQKIPVILYNDATVTAVILHFTQWQLPKYFKIMFSDFDNLNQNLQDTSTLEVYKYETTGNKEQCFYSPVHSVISKVKRLCVRKKIVQWNPFYNQQPHKFLILNVCLVVLAFITNWKHICTYSEK